MCLKRIASVFLLMMVYFMVYGEEADETLIMRIGDKKLKNKIMDVSADKIYSADEGNPIPFLKMIKEMQDARFIYIGETHNSMAMHKIQLKIIQALFKQDRDLAIGLEMLPVSLQKVLNKWSLAILSQEEFIRESQWYVNWNFNFGYYEKILKFAKENKILICALNVPRSIIRKIRIKRWEVLSEEEKKMIPQPDLSHEEHRLLIRTIFKKTEIPHQMKGRGLDEAFEGLYRAQSAWDGVMAFNALKASEQEDKRMVVLAGSGHLLYNLGINRRVYERNHLPFRTVLPIVVPEEKRSVQVVRSLADYVWGIPEEKTPAFPYVGLRLKKIAGLDNLVIKGKSIEGVSKNANFEKGDLILSVDGKSFSDINELRIYLTRFKWNDEVKIRLLRNAEELEVLLKFHPPEKK